MRNARFKDSDKLEKMRQRYKLVNDTEANQDEREQSDIAFENDEQWTSVEKTQRSGQQPVNGMPAVPARPTLVFNKVKEPVRQILNQERAADIGIQITPADDFGDLGITPDDTEVLLREGLVRRITRESHAKDARTWAYKRAVIAGRGYYIVRQRFLPGKTWDQEIYVDRIFNQAGVKLDPSHEKPNGSDADWGFVGTWMPFDRFKAEYPKDVDGDTNPFTEYSEGDFIGLTEQYPGWYKAENDEPAVRIVDYWYTERTHRELAVLADGSSHWADELPEGVEAVDTRTVIEKTIQFCKVAGGVMTLEETTESGPNMPIVKVVGDEVLPYDEERRYIGVVRPARDSNKGFNYMVSKQVEVLGLTPIPLLQLDPDAIDGYESWYDVINTRALPWAPYRSRDDQGQELRPPQRLAVDPNIYPISQSVALFDALIKSTTAVPDSTLGNVDPSLKSGKAIKEVVANAQLSTSNFFDNLVRSMEYECQIINDKLEPVYGARPGRLVRIMTGEGEEQTIAVGQPPHQAQGQPGQAPQPTLQQKAAKVAKLTKDARFNVIMKPAKSTENRRQQFVEMFGQILGADPAQMLVAGDLFYKNMDIPEARQLSKRMRLMLAPPVQQYLHAEENGQNFDPAAQAQISQLQQQLQQLSQIAQEQGKAIETKQIETQARGQIEQMKIQADQQIEQVKMQADAAKAKFEADRDIEIERMKNATAIRIAEINAQAKGIITGHELMHEAQAMGQEQAHEQSMAQMGQDHERGLAESAAQQSQIQAAEERAFQRSQQESGASE
jgi:hypothetical protein